MIDLEKLKSVLAGYKADFQANWDRAEKPERFKWEAVKWFRDHWDINAEDFGKMFMEATRRVGSLLDSGGGNLPRTFVNRLSRADDAATRELFRALYDETIDLSARVMAFSDSSRTLWEKYYRDTKKLYTSSASTFLWLRYPDKYYVYKHSRSDAANNALNAGYTIMGNNSPESMLAGFRLNDEIRKELKKDGDIQLLLQQALTSDCYPDPELITTTVDFVNYLYKKVEQRRNPARNDLNSESEADLSRQGDLLPSGEVGYAESDNSAGQTIEPSEENIESVPDDYSEADFLKEVYMSERDRSHLAGLLENKKNIILQGAPGVGKTFAAKRLAWSVLGKKDKKRVRMVQFHQSYSYDEFVMGYRPNGTGFERTPGIFYDFCKDAENDPGNKHFFIIDEINRGNLSKIFGELLMLIENSHRGDPIDLSYKKPCEDGNGGTVWQREEFSVPGNLYLIGTMNTVDRGLTKFDHALRQRFGVFTMHPAFESDGFKKYLEERNSEKLSALIAETKKLNNEIADSLGKDFVIGHRWFCRGNDEAVTDEWLYSIVEYDILPLLEEYWFDQEENVDRWSRKLHEVLGVEDAR